MKTLALCACAIAAMALIVLQHEQLGLLRAENVVLQQARAEADGLKADLSKSTGAEADAEDEITRLREENRDLLKLRSQVYQLREATAQFEQVRAENVWLQSLARSASTNSNSMPVLPIIIRIQTLSNQGLGTPEAAVQTFFWAERQGNADELGNCIVPERWARRPADLRGYPERSLDNVDSIEIVASRHLDPTTIQLGIQIVQRNNSRHPVKIVLTLRLRGGEWKLDSDILGI